MNTYFEIIDDLQEIAIAEPFINTVTQGDITDVDLNKSTIFPLCHLSVTNASIASNLVTLDVSVILMDIIDFSKDNPSSDIRGNNNEMDTLNTQLNVASRLQATILRNSNIRDTYQLEGPFSCEPFTERFEANLSGWSVTFSISMNNSMTSC
jgi:hypothetical protein|tara:strand:+ start:1382 stop:1837 length:456 start_codon:yes stop_codon:yes gene_type:complete